jgi:hypothetical protein
LIIPIISKYSKQQTTMTTYIDNSEIVSIIFRLIETKKEIKRVGYCLRASTQYQMIMNDIISQLCNNWSHEKLTCDRLGLIGEQIANLSTQCKTPFIEGDNRFLPISVALSNILDDLYAFCRTIRRECEPMVAGHVQQKVDEEKFSGSKKTQKPTCSAGHACANNLLKHREKFYHPKIRCDRGDDCDETYAEHFEKFSHEDE